MANFIVLLGSPGSGKGTQAQLIENKIGLPHISSGEIFRENFKNRSQLGNLAQTYIQRGELVPDDITIATIRERLSLSDCRQGALMDGFPRTIFQAEALEKMLAEFRSKVDIVLYINVSEDVLVRRLTGRWTCRAQGHVFHQEFNPPKKANRCDYDSSVLFQRKDDQMNTAIRRIRVYIEQTTPLIEYYRKKGLLVEICGMQAIEQVTEDLMAAIHHGNHP